MAGIYTATSAGWAPLQTAGGGGGPPPPSGIMWGINVDGVSSSSDHTTRLQQYGRIPCSRIYYQQAFPNSIGIKETGSAPEKRWQMSWKGTGNGCDEILNGTLDNAITSYANSVAAYSPSAKAFMTFHHEANGDFTGNTGAGFTRDNWKNASIYVSQLLWSLPTRNQVIPMLSYSSPKGVYPAQANVPWDDTYMINFNQMGNPNAQISFDCYGNPAGGGGVASQYTSMAFTFSNTFHLITLGGWDFEDFHWGITETNTPLRSWDTGSVARIQWFKDCINELSNNGPSTPQHIFLWEAASGNNWDQSLNLPAERLPWKNAFATSI